MTEANDDALLAAVMRRLLTETNPGGAAYSQLFGNRELPTRGLGLDIEHAIDISPEEYDALNRAGAET